MNPTKLLLARMLAGTGLSRVGLLLQRLGGPYLRALNYHDVPRARAADFERQLERYARHFDPVGQGDLLAFLDGSWTPRRPGLILTFDDGLRSHAEVAAPLLERYGFPGWFAVPAGFPDMEVTDHDEFMRSHKVRYEGSDFADGRPLLDWDDLRRLDRNHVICCHTASHRRLEASLSDEDRVREIAEAKRRLEAGLGHEISAFVWVGGEEWSYSAEAAHAIRDAGFTLGFMTNSARIRRGSDRFQLQRTNVEADHPEAVVGLGLSGIVDLLYRAKRRRVDRLTAAPV